MTMLHLSKNQVEFQLHLYQQFKELEQKWVQTAEEVYRQNQTEDKIQRQTVTFDDYIEESSINQTNSFKFPYVHKDALKQKFQPLDPSEIISSLKFWEFAQEWHLECIKIINQEIKQLQEQANFNNWWFQHRIWTENPFGERLLRVDQSLDELSMISNLKIKVPEVKDLPKAISEKFDVVKARKIAEQMSRASEIVRTILKPLDDPQTFLDAIQQNSFLHEKVKQAFIKQQANFFEKGVDDTLDQRRKFDKHLNANIQNFKTNIEKLWQQITTELVPKTITTFVP